MTLDEYSQYKIHVFEANPVLEFQADRDNSDAFCWYPSQYGYANASNDLSVLPDFPAENRRAYRLRLTITVNWTRESQLLINDNTQQIKDWVEAGFHVRTVPSLPDDLLKESITYVGDSVPVSLKAATGIVASIFWTGIAHLYRVDSIPIWHGTVHKFDAVISMLPSASDFDDYKCKNYYKEDDTYQPINNF
jgi:hypothetical protein